MQITLPFWFDAHTHLRQGPLLAPLVAAQQAMGCHAVLAMPNTRPPTAKVFDDDGLPYASVEAYMNDIRAAGGTEFESLIVPLYLTRDTTPAMIEKGAARGILKACKYYPPHGTTGADFGYPFAHFLSNGVFKAMQDNGVILCIHGEEHGMRGEDYISRTTSAEEFFYRERMPRLAEACPGLKVVCEHITTKVAADFVEQAGPTVGATVTPQHLLYTLGDLMMGLRYHLFCLPLLKFEDDRQALRRAVLRPGQSRIFAGTDSAPHTKKATECGCAAGCFTGGIAPQLYAQGFEAAGADLSDPAGAEAFRRFLCDNGPDFYGIGRGRKTFTLSRTPQSVGTLDTPDGPVTPLPLGLGQQTLPWALSL